MKTQEEEDDDDDDENGLKSLHFNKRDAASRCRNLFWCCRNFVKLV
jgi:hypothetical protein